MSAIDNGFLAISDLGLWFKVQSNDALYLSDLPALIKIRLDYIVENWLVIGANILASLDQYDDPFRLQTELKAFDVLVQGILAGSSVTPSEAFLLSRYFTIFDSIAVDSINISKQEQSIILSEVKRVNTFTKAYFLSIKTSLIAARDEIADRIGGGDADYNRIKNRSSTRKILNKSINEIQFSDQFQQAVAVVDAILANESILGSGGLVDPFAFARANANNPEFNIETYSSGKLIRMNFGETLQQLAGRVFGNPDKWIDIAIANGLKPPYVDEIGSAVPLIANGNGNKLNVPALNTNGGINRNIFYINQIIVLQSDVERNPDQRTIKNIIEIPVSGELVIELSGNSDLAKYKTSEKAYARVYAPQTINSSLFVLIPGFEELSETVRKSTPWFLRSSGEDEKRAGVDFLISDKGDLAFTPTGDIQLSYGAANGLQALSILLSTELGSLIRHSNYGIGSIVGETNSNVIVSKQKLAESVGTQILNDPRFDRLSTLTVESLVDSSGFKVFAEVVLAGGSTAIPISFVVNTN